MTKTETPKLPKRTWHYLLQPAEYEVHCMRGKKINEKHKVTWSEFEGMIWCYDCKKDMRGFDGIFGGPIPVQAAQMILGKYCFHRYNLVKKVIEAPVTRGGKIFHRACPALTKRLQRAK